jgi:hypothetical protein
MFANHTEQRSNKSGNIKKGASKHPQHPQPGCRVDEDSTKIIRGRFLNRSAILLNLKRIVRT